MAEQCFIIELPLEMLQEIGHHLENDSDLLCFARTCRDIRGATEGDRGSFWRRRFMAVFDKPEFTEVENRSKQNAKYRRLYTIRQSLLKIDEEYLHYSEGKTANEQKSLHVLHGMFVESFSKARGDHSKQSNNIEHLERFADRINICTPFSPPRRRWVGKWDSNTSYKYAEPSEDLLLIQCLFAPAILRQSSCGGDSCYGFQASQSAVYSTKDDLPFFKGPGASVVDLKLVVDHLNFWKFWLVVDPHKVLQNAFQELAENERPRYWDTKLNNKHANLGGRWKGTYAFLPSDELALLREDSDRASHDEFPGEDDGQPFQDLNLCIVDQAAHFWPESFEQHVEALNRTEPQIKTRAQRRAMLDGEMLESVSFRFSGDGSDQKDDFLASGWLNTLPSQRGIPGWQRMTMMKYYLDPDTGVIDDNSLWAYEGVVLPGSKIIVGRWWRAQVNDEEFYSGPFILWCVDS